MANLLTILVSESTSGSSSCRYCCNELRNCSAGVSLFPSLMTISNEMTHISSNLSFFRYSLICSSTVP